MPVTSNDLSIVTEANGRDNFIKIADCITTQCECR